MSPVSDEQVVRTLLWRRVDVAGVEHFQLRDSPRGAQLVGTVLVPHEGAPLRLDYEVACSGGWETRRVTMTVSFAAAARRVELVADEKGRWWMDGAERPDVTGCVDVDLSLTPSTNTLPVRRLGLLDLPVGQSRDVRAAWVRFPELRVEPLEQRYTRVGERRLRYESRRAHSDRAFTADLDVDDIGLVVTYPPLWERVALA